MDVKKYLWHIVSYYRLQIYDFLVKNVRFALTFYKLLDEKPRFLLSSSLRLNAVISLAAVLAWVSAGNGED